MKLFFLALASCLFFTHPTHAQTGLSNDLIWASREFSADFVGGLNSMNDGLHYTSTEPSDAFGTTIIKYSYETGKQVATITTSKDVFGDVTTSIEGYEFSADEQQLLIQTATEPIYRYSFSANYYVHNLKTKTTRPLADFDRGKQMLAGFSPGGNSIAFVRNNNLFVVDATSGKETQITTDGEKNKIINGGTDWVYEEEFAISKGFEWSPDGKKIAFYRFDESEVPEYGMDLYGSLYPAREEFKYPKAGEKNSKVSIYIWDSSTGRNTLVNTGAGDIYLPRIKWTADGSGLCIMRMNRHQNQLEFLLANVSKDQPFQYETAIMFSETASTYIDINESLTFLKDKSGFIWMSERDDFNHIYLFDMKGQVVKQITKGPWDVIDFYGVDELNGTVYYSSSEVSPMEKRVYSFNYKKKKSTPVCLSKSKGTNDAEFSKGFKNYILTHSDANTPPDIALYSNNGKLIRVLVDNTGLKDRLSKYQLANKEFFTFKNNEGTSLNCWMMKPTNFDASKKYPVLVAIYGGPGSNTVNDSWGGRSGFWHQLLCQEGYIVVSCDPRGTMNRGRKFKHSTYMNLGKLETEDFIDFAKYLGQQSYIDKGRIGMQGWSYGGYMTSLCMTKGADYYKAGIAVAPVTNWKYYDTIYTERFMRTPAENNGGYENNSPINFADQLKGKYLLVHGSADDNVHFQNTMDMITALVAANKQFDLFVYPNKNHGIYGGNTRLHLFNQMTDFLKANL